MEQVCGVYPDPNLTRISGGKEQSQPSQVKGSALTWCYHAEGQCGPFLQNKHQIQSYAAPTSNSDPVGKEAVTVSLKLPAWMISHQSEALWY